MIVSLYRSNKSKDKELRWVTKCSSNKGFSGNSSVLPRIKFVLVDKLVPRNPLLLLHSAVIRKSDGTVLLGQFIIARNAAGKTAIASTSLGNIDSDEHGNIYLSHISTYKMASRDKIYINGNSIGDYAGGDIAILKVSPDMLLRKMWTTFSKTPAVGQISAVGVGLNGVVFVGGFTISSV